jgi:spermidine synthase
MSTSSMSGWWPGIGAKINGDGFWRATGLPASVVNSPWLFLTAYACSGFAGLMYEVAWVRTLTLYMGHTTAATSTVVAAFMGGLAAGSAIGGRVAARLSARGALAGYALLESIVILMAIVLPVELGALAPLLRWAYRDGAPGALFPTVRLTTCLVVLMVPTMAIGATFPLTVRWFVSRSPQRTGESTGRLYAANTAGAAIGMVAAGFFLIPAIGVFGTTLVGVAGSALSIGVVLVIARRPSVELEIESDVSRGRAPRSGKRAQHKGTKAQHPSVGKPGLWLAGIVLASTGFATLLYEIAWTRLFSPLIGPSTYAFAATVTGLIGGLAIGSAVGSRLTGRVRRPEIPLALALLAAATAASGASTYAATAAPLAIAERFARAPQAYWQHLLTDAALAAVLVAPIAIALGIAFPLALEIAGARTDPGEPYSHSVRTAAQRLGVVYATNTVASVGGSLAAGFFLLPVLGLQSTLRLADCVLIGGAFMAFTARGLSMRARIAGLLSSLAAVSVIFSSSPWDRALLASGGYKYAPYVPKGLDLATALKAGTLLYYREGPTGIVTVKRLTGNLSLGIDGKVDASTSSDMLTQKTLAHLPLLLHGHARTICIIGLGSGVTLASALVHPIAAADVVEISPEVVEASHFFSSVNHQALDDPRTRLIIGDGRSHLALSSARYDVIISEPSNPWMAGVAALFTREFFTEARDRLAPDGIICQWAHTYDISESDLRSVVRTFATVFPQGTMWLVGDGDLLLVGSAAPLDPRLDNIQDGWNLPAVAADLAGVSMRDPFALLSMFVGGPVELQRYGGAAVAQIDDRLALEFSGPRAVNGTAAATNTATLRRLLEGDRTPTTIARARSAAGAGQWRDRGTMMLGAAAYDVAYQDFLTASRLDPADHDALSGIVRAAVPLHREADAATVLESLATANPTSAAPRIALSKLEAAAGAFRAAVAAAEDAWRIERSQPEPLDQLASLYADAGDAAQLDAVVDQLRRLFPARATTRYYEAASRFLHGDLPGASTLAQQSIEMEPRRAASRNLLGAIQASLGQSERARAAFQAALGLDSHDSATYTNLGLLELSSGDGTRAANLFAEALSIDPASDSARQGLAQAMMARGAR